MERIDEERRVTDQVSRCDPLCPRVVVEVVELQPIGERAPRERGEMPHAQERTEPERRGEERRVLEDRARALEEMHRRAIDGPR